MGLIQGMSHLRRGRSRGTASTSPRGLGRSSSRPGQRHHGRVDIVVLTCRRRGVRQGMMVVGMMIVMRRRYHGGTVRPRRRRRRSGSRVIATTSMRQADLAYRTKGRPSRGTIGSGRHPILRRDGKLHVSHRHATTLHCRRVMATTGLGLSQDDGPIGACRGIGRSGHGTTRRVIVVAVLIQQGNGIVCRSEGQATTRWRRLATLQGRRLQGCRVGSMATTRSRVGCLWGECSTRRVG